MTPYTLEHYKELADLIAPQMPEGKRLAFEKIIDGVYEVGKLEGLKAGMREVRRINKELVEMRYKNWKSNQNK